MGFCIISIRGPSEELECLMFCLKLCAPVDCKNEPRLQNPIKDPARLQWHEVYPERCLNAVEWVKKVDHYYLSIDAVTQPMKVREEEIPYGDQKK